MITKYETKQLKLNAELNGIPKGSIIGIKVDKKGLPTEKYWRDRVKDAKIDKCVNILSDKDLAEIAKAAKVKAAEIAKDSKKKSTQSGDEK